ncbi:MAG: sugar phosphate isomerase/epimerase [Anaerolineae bacterium]|nr:sugar phosphate isomerase/epimerase [Phycisphaerae bacterium]
MYTLREFTKTPADIAKTLSRVKQLGYDAVQLSALGPIDAKELATILSNEGLACCATHISLDRMKNETAAVIDDHKLWNCNYTAIGGFFPKDPTEQDWLDFAREYSEIASKFDGSGMSIGYHNHSHELARYGHTTAMQLLLEKLSPKIWFEVDTYWIAHGGADPIQWIDKVSGRTPCVHFKDMAIRNDRTQYMAEVGVGNLNWPGIIKACQRAGVQWYIVEQDICYRDPFDSVKTSLENLKAMGLS